MGCATMLPTHCPRFLGFFVLVFSLVIRAISNENTKLHRAFFFVTLIAFELVLLYLSSLSLELATPSSLKSALMKGPFADVHSLV